MFASRTLDDCKPLQLCSPLRGFRCGSFLGKENPFQWGSCILPTLFSPAHRARLA